MYVGHIFGKTTCFRQEKEDVAFVKHNAIGYVLGSNLTFHISTTVMFFCDCTEMINQSTCR